MASLTDGFGRKVVKYQVRIRSEEPTVINFTEVHYTATPEEIMEEVFTLVRRTSYMVEGPNREVWWAIDHWTGEHWECLADGKSRLRKNAKPPA